VTLEHLGRIVTLTHWREKSYGHDDSTCALVVISHSFDDLTLQ
jgi:hypothetical protein